MKIRSRPQGSRRGKISSVCSFAVGGLLVAVALFLVLIQSILMGRMVSKGNDPSLNPFSQSVSQEKPPGRSKQNSVRKLPFKPGSPEAAAFAETAKKASTTKLQAKPTLTEETEIAFNYSLPAIRSQYTLADPRIYYTTGPGQNTDSAMTRTIVLVLSARDHFHRRESIRETWGRGHPVYFVIGGPSTLTLTPAEQTAQKKLVAEQERHQDLLDAMHPESYRSLPYKVQFAYTWITSHYDPPSSEGSSQKPRIDWIVKVDDDSVARVDTLLHSFLPNFNSRIPIVIGRIVEQSPVWRVGANREMQYQHAYYPYWPRGSCGHVVSYSVAKYIGTAKGLTYYQGEDVSIGIWLDEAQRLPVTDENESVLPGRRVTYMNSDFFRHDFSCLTSNVDDWLIMGHKMTATEMRECYKHVVEAEAALADDQTLRYWNVETLQQTKRRTKEATTT